MPRPSLRGGGHRGSFRGGPGHLLSSHNIGNGRSPTTEPPYVFSLADEARSTAHGHSPWSLGSRLRNQPVSFVSAGAVDPLKQLEDQLQRLEKQLQFKAHEALDDLSRYASTNEPHNTTEKTHNESDVLVPAAVQGPMFDVVPVGPWDGLGSASDHIEEDYSSQQKTSMFPAMNVDGTLDMSAGADTGEAMVAVSPRTPPSPLSFFIDTTGDSSHHQQAALPEGPQHEPVPEPDTDSSEEVILFKGRNQPRQNNRQALSQNPGRPRKKREEKPFDLEDIRAEVHQLVAKVNDSMASSTHQPNQSGKTRTKKKNKKPKARDTDKLNLLEDAGAEQDAILADYIANMRQNGDDEDLITSQGHARRDLGGSDMDFHMGDDLHPAPGDRNSGLDEKLDPEDEFATLPGDRDGTDDQFKNHGLNLTSTTDGDFLLAHLLAAGVPSSADESEYGDPDDFDFMEWGEPITKQMRKQKKGKLPIFNVSDSELEATLQSAYKNDRLKKAERKKEREKLRTQGLLGTKVNTEDLRVKYPQGMSIEQIAQELETFLKSNQTSLSLPPMDNHARKVLHELANKFNVRSKSTGSGDQRRPTLYRTARTFKYSEDEFDRAISRVGRKYFPRRDLGARWGGGRGPARRGGGQADTGYRDGEVVGGSAPELGQENRGRAMLEKMGWSTGTALGSMSNKGILQPVEQKVKRGKAGLG